VSSLEPRIDDLYQRPLDQFVSARNALAKSLEGDDAGRVRKLTKPAVVPWAINQVYWRARAVHDFLMKTGARLRLAQVAALEGKEGKEGKESKQGHPGALRSAADAHRRALADAVHQAERFAAEGGAHPDPDALMKTFEALSLAPQPPATPGRLTRPLQPAGFEALAGIAVRAQAPAAAPEKGAASPPHDPGAARKEEAARRKREADLKKAEARVERARRQMLEAQEALRRTREQAS
jgi:hypothetical protein